MEVRKGFRPTNDNVVLEYYGRHDGIDKFFTKVFGYGKRYQLAWKVTAYIRKYWPAFERWTRGNCRGVQSFSNGITNAGKAEVAGLAGSTGSCTAFTYLAYGTGSTAFAASQTALVSQSQRASATVSRTTTTVSNDTLKLVKAFSVVSTETAAEGGVFNASSGGDMLARVVFSPSRSMTSGDTITYTHYISFA